MNAKRRMPRRVALYVRTSTANGQTTRNQERELQAAAKHHGWAVATIYRDQGISGGGEAQRRAGAPELHDDGAVLDRRDPANAEVWIKPMGEVVA